MRFIADKSHRTFWVILAQCLARARARNTPADDEVVSLDHARTLTIPGHGMFLEEKFVLAWGSRSQFCFIKRSQSSLPVPNVSGRVRLSGANQYSRERKPRPVS